MLYILGSNTDDRSTQLEQLGQDRLASHGKSKLTLNALGLGSAQFEVTGKHAAMVKTTGEILIGNTFSAGVENLDS